MTHPGQMSPKSQLSDYVDDWEADHKSHVLEVYVKRLRQKRGWKLMQTRRGQGYVFQVSK